MIHLEWKEKWKEINPSRLLFLAANLTFTKIKCPYRSHRIREREREKSPNRIETSEKLWKPFEFLFRNPSNSRSVVEDAEGEGVQGSQRFHVAEARSAGDLRRPSRRSQAERRRRLPLLRSFSLWPRRFPHHFFPRPRTPSILTSYLLVLLLFDSLLASDFSAGILFGRRSLKISEPKAVIC